MPKGSKIVTDSWGPYLDTDHHEITYVFYIGDKDLQAYQVDNVDYLILNTINFSRMFSASSDPRAAEVVERRKQRLRQITRELPLEQKFVGPALFNPPVVSVFIYKVQ